MRRLFIEGELSENIIIRGADAHHLMHVMRAKAGEQLTVVDDHGQVALLEMTAFTAETVTLRMVERLEADTEPPVELTLAQCLLKADKMDWIVQKAVELGATCIVPVASQNCVVRYDARKSVQRRERWQKIADEAAKQCGRTKLVEVKPILGWQELVKMISCGNSEWYFCYENEQQQKLKESLRQSKADSLSVLIGPEGGFTPTEAESVEQAGGKSVTLGPRILRAETAALAALSVLQYEAGDLGG